MPTPSKPIPIEPLSGALDLRSPPGAVAFTNFRLALNFSMNEHRRRCRDSGWKRAFKDSQYGFRNQDLHDQLASKQFYYDGPEPYSTTIGGQLSGYTYPFIFPNYGVPYTARVLTDLGEMCGYAPDWYGVYGTDPNALMGTYLHDVFIGWPYTPCVQQTLVSQPMPLSGDIPANYPLTTIQSGGELQFRLRDVFPYHVKVYGVAQNYRTPDLILGPFDQDVELYCATALIYTQSLLINGVAASPTSAGAVLASVPAGSTVSINIRAEITNYYIGAVYPFDLIGIRATSTEAVYAGCNSGAPDYCKTSYFYLTHIDLETRFTQYGTYVSGDPIPVYTPSESRFFENCDTLYQDLQRCCREPITFLKEFRSSSGLRRLLAGTKSRLYVLNETSANWRILADRLGGDYSSDDCDHCPTTRFRSASLGDYIVLSNNFDPVMYWHIDDTGSGCDLWSAHAIDDLASLSITRARVVVEWKGFMFVMNFEENYVDKPFALVWSDYNGPLDFIPGGESIAGRHEFGSGERILVAAPIGDYLYIYTDQAIHQCQLAGQVDEVFRFREIYRGPQMPRFANSFVSTGDAHLWCGVDGIYTLTGYSSSPQRVQWIHDASAAIYSGLDEQFVEGFDHLQAFGAVDQAHCDNLIGFYDDVRQEVWFSWPTRGNDCANMSLKLSLRYATATLVDYGWTAGCSYTPDKRPSVRDFFSEMGVCDPYDLGVDLKEGTPVVPSVVGAAITCLVNPTEDPNLPSSDDSLCAKLATLRLEDICGDCDAPRTLISASAQDKTLKEHDPEVYAREEFTQTSSPYACGDVVGDYALKGYASLLQGDASKFGTDFEKLISQVTVDFSAAAQTIPNKVMAQVAWGAQPGCLLWAGSEPVKLECLTEQTDQQLNDSLMRPGPDANFKFFRRGKYLAWRIWIDAPEGSTEITGGKACFNKVILDVRAPEQRRMH